jgi:hypothetical protein
LQKRKPGKKKLGQSSRIAVPKNQTLQKKANKKKLG